MALIERTEAGVVTTDDFGVALQERPPDAPEDAEPVLTIVWPPSTLTPAQALRLAAHLIHTADPRKVGGASNDWTVVLDAVGDERFGAPGNVCGEPLSGAGGMVVGTCNLPKGHGAPVHRAPSGEEWPAA